MTKSIESRAVLPPNHRSNAPGERPFVHAPPFRVVIPTRDSSATIGVFLDAYRKIGIEPIYILDARSVDDSARVLKRMNATVHEFTPDRNFAEAGMLAHAAQFIDTEWALRMDDDEFPSIELIRWLSARGACLEKDVCALSRRELFS